MSGGVVCRSCGTENGDDLDFCSACGEYLRWEMTRAMPAAIQVQGETPPPVPAVAILESGEEGDPAEGPPEKGETVVETGGNGDQALPREDEHDDDAPTAVNTAVLAAALPGHLIPVAAYTPPALPVAGGATLVLQRAGGEELLPGEAVIAGVDAGGRVSFEFMLRNTSRIVENYDLAISGLPEGWTTITPDTVDLNPFGSRGASEHALSVEVAPPRAPESAAREWPFELIVLSRVTGAIVARTPATVNIREFTAWQIETEPHTRSGRLRGRYAVTLSNLGNAPLQLWLYATDPEGRLHGQFAPRMLPMSAGESRTAQLELRPPRPRLLGRAIEHRAAIEALPDEPDPEEPREPLSKQLKKFVSGGGVSVGPHGVQVRKPRVKMPRPPQRQLKLEDLKRLSGGGPAGPLTPTQVAFRQQALIPAWLIVLAMIAAALVALYLLTRTHKVHVPNVIGAKNTFAAQQELRSVGLALNPTVQQAPSTKPAGSVIGQDPSSGKLVKKGTQVTIEVAASTGKEQVPPLAGMTRAEADAALQKRNLTLGQVEPLTAPLTWVVASQIPEARLRVPVNSAVQVFLRAPHTSKAGNASKAGSAAQAAAGASSATGGKKAKVTVPPIKGRIAQAYYQAVAQLGLVPHEVASIDKAPSGTLLAVDPAPGTKVAGGSALKLDVSEGTPDLAYVERGQVHVIDPATGKQLGVTKPANGTALAPSFSPAGTKFVYTSATGSAQTPGATPVLQAVTSDPAFYVPIYAGTDIYLNITYAPTALGKPNVLALEREIEGIGELCLSGLPLGNLVGQCLPDDSWNLDGSISWSPDGRQILASGSLPTDPPTFGVRRFTTATPFSTNPAQWQGGTATPVNKPGQGVIEAAFSPSGKQVALVTNLGSSYYRVVIVTAANLSNPAMGRALPLQACDAAWRPDGKEIAVVESTDATCQNPVGKIVQVSVADPKQQSVIASSGSDVTFQPLPPSP